MRQAGGWLLGCAVVAAMAGGAWIAFRPILQRKTIPLVVSSGGFSTPTHDALLSGFRFALDHSGHRAGNFKMELSDLDLFNVKREPSVYLHTGGSEVVTAEFIGQPRALVQPSLPTKIRILPTLEEVGRAMSAWVTTLPGRALLLVDDEAPQESGVAGGVRAAAGNAVPVIVSPLHDSGTRDLALARVLAEKPDTLVFAGEEAPYNRAFEVFDGLRKKGFAGRLVMADADPGVSFLAIPTSVVEGALLVSPLGPPSKEFASVYEPATGRRAGPHAFPGYLLMNAVASILERAGSGSEADLREAFRSYAPEVRPCALYLYREGRFVFDRELK